MLEEESNLVTLDRKWLNPLVYLIFSDDVLLYIGSSKNGLLRLQYHHVLSVDKLKEINTNIKVIFCDSEFECRNLEMLLIDEFKPILNTKTIVPQAERNIKDLIAGRRPRVRIKIGASRFK